MLRGGMIVSIVYSSIPLGFIVLAEAIVLLNGNFDLSVGQIAGLAAAIGGIVASSGRLPPALTITVPIGIGFLCGAINGFLVGNLKLNAFLATLGTFLAFDGAQLLIRHQVIFEFPASYLAPGGNMFISISSFIGTLLFFQFFLYNTKYGYHFVAVGSTPRAASMLGVSLRLSRFLAFVISGVLSGIAGLYYTGYTAAYGPLIAEGTVFLAFAAAVLGGISLTGGRGRIVNVFGGLILLGTISSGLTIMAISPYLRRMLFGTIVIIAILLDASRNRFRESVMKGA